MRRDGTKVMSSLSNRSFDPVPRDSFFAPVATDRGKTLNLEPGTLNRSLKVSLERRAKRAAPIPFY